jgi:DNA-binding MarR family transcriptional regulator
MERDDRIELRRKQWAKEMPDLDTTGMSILGRARVITLGVRPAIETVFERFDLDTGDFDVVSTLLRSGPPYRLRPTELFRWLMITSGGLSARLARLEKRGLVERIPDPADGRSLLVALTDKGLSKARAAIVEDMRTEAELLSGLSENERETLAELLRKLALSLEAKEL